MAKDYSSVMGLSCPGCLVDSTRYNIDGTGVCGSESIIAGKVVFFKERVEGYNIFVDHKEGDAVVAGVAIRSNITTTVNEDGGYSDYKEGDPISVVTRGRVWVLTESIDEAPSHGEKVYVNNDGFVGKSGDQVVDGWIFTGDFMKFDSSINIVGIHIKPVIVHVQKLTAAIIEDVDGNKPDGNRPNNEPVNLKVTVEPEYATDKTGTWEISLGGEYASISPSGDTAQVTPSSNGDVYVNWVANDGSGVSDTFIINFVDPEPGP